MTVWYRRPRRAVPALDKQDSDPGAKENELLVRRVSSGEVPVVDDELPAVGLAPP